MNKFEQSETPDEGIAGYPSDFIKKVKAEFPDWDWESIKEASEHGVDYFADFLEEDCEFTMKPGDIVQAFKEGKQKDILEKAIVADRRGKLYAEYLELASKQEEEENQLMSKRKEEKNQVNKMIPDEGKLNFEYTKGNIDVAVHQSKEPIPSERIDAHIIDFLSTKAGENAELLKVSNFNLEFFVYGTMKGFFKFSVESGNKKEFEFTLQGEDLQKFIDLVHEYGSGFDFSKN